VPWLTVNHGSDISLPRKAMNKSVAFLSRVDETLDIKSNLAAVNHHQERQPT
jgi:hypothetical protein